MYEPYPGQYAQVVEDYSDWAEQGQVETATEVQYLVTFNQSISQAMAKTMEHLSDFGFIFMADSYKKWLLPCSG